MHCCQTYMRKLLLAFMSVLFLAAGQATSAASEPPVASRFSILQEGQDTVLRIALSGVVEARSFALANPFRVIVDLNEVSFQFPRHSVEQQVGAIKTFRYGLFAAGKSRIVLDVEEPVLVSREIKQMGNAYELMIRLQPTDMETFNAAYAAPKPRRSTAQAPLNHAPDLKGKIVVVIDPGHGGVDPGAVGQRGMREKDLVLKVAKRLAKELGSHERFEVHLTRDNDTFIALGERVEIARRLKADLFISIHADSIAESANSVRGATVYTLSERASDAQAAALAAKENRADLIAGVEVDADQSEVADILIDLVRRETKNFSIFFARKFIDKMDNAIRLNNNPHRFAGFRVLKAPDVPSVLIELGYLSNKEDEALLSSDSWQQKFARSSAQAIIQYFEVRLAGNGG